MQEEAKHLERLLHQEETFMANMVGQQLGNYRLTHLLGQGGFAEVYLGEHTRLGMQAAIKVLHAYLRDEDTAVFQQEARTIAQLRHPSIIRVLDFDIQNGTPFLVLDYAPNGSLRQKHPRGTRIALEQVVGYVNQIAGALHYAHTQKLIHRDVKPENILVGQQGEILLSDFGIASIAHATSSMSTQTSMGTLAYMAPEQLQGKPRKESDQYALGITVYQWLCGTLPFLGSSTEIIAQHLTATPPSLREKVPDISPEVERAIMRALAKDPKERFESMLAFASTLEKAAQRKGVSIAHSHESSVISKPSPVSHLHHPLAKTTTLEEIQKVGGEVPVLVRGTAEARKTAGQQGSVASSAPGSPEKIWPIHWIIALLLAFVLIAVSVYMLLPSH
jgi:serine/threonine protein kinase